MPAASHGQPAPPPSPPGLAPQQVFLRFLRFGLLAWGGPVAQIGMLRRELVDEERWVSSARFNRLLALYQVLPGPEAHELCVYFGRLAAGRLGGLLAGLAFMLPGFLLMFLLSWLYVTTDITRTVALAAFLGMQPAVIALIVRAVHRIGSHVLLDRWLWAIAVVTGLAALAGTPFWISLPIAGVVHVLAGRGRQLLAAAALAALLPVALWSAQGPGAGAAGGPISLHVADATLAALFLSGLKAGLLTFGGAYTAIPFLQADAVGRGWMSEGQFVDGLALSGILPAPLIIFSTFVGYVAGGPAGAIVMTVAVFLPAFVFALFLHDQLERLLERRGIHALLEGVSAGVVGLIAATTVELAVHTLHAVPGTLVPVAIFATALAALYLLTMRTAVLWVMLGAALAGTLLFGA